MQPYMCIGLACERYRRLALNNCYIVLQTTATSTPTNGTKSLLHASTQTKSNWTTTSLDMFPDTYPEFLIYQCCNIRVSPLALVPRRLKGWKGCDSRMSVQIRSLIWFWWLMKAHWMLTVTQQPLQYTNLAGSSNFQGTEKSQIITQVKACFVGQQQVAEKGQSVVSSQKEHEMKWPEKWRFLITVRSCNHTYVSHFPAEMHSLWFHTIFIPWVNNIMLCNSLGQQ